MADVQDVEASDFPKKRKLEIPEQDESTQCYFSQDKAEKPGSTEAGETSFEALEQDFEQV